MPPLAEQLLLLLLCPQVTDCRLHTHPLRALPVSLHQGAPLCPWLPRPLDRFPAADPCFHADLLGLICELLINPANARVRSAASDFLQVRQISLQRMISQQLPVRRAGCDFAFSCSSDEVFPTLAGCRRYTRSPAKTRARRCSQSSCSSCLSLQLVGHGLKASSACLL